MASDCDWFQHICSVSLEPSKDYPNYTEGDLWDVIMVKSRVNV